MDENDINQRAMVWVKNKDNQKAIITKYASLSIFPSVKRPATIMTAGCTGAGKTEFSSRLLNLTEKLPNTAKYVRVDADVFYKEIKQQLKINSDCREELKFPCIKLVELVADHAIKYDQNLLIDSSFSQEKSITNVQRAIKHGRSVHIYFIYEQPKMAWQYVLKREKFEGRSVSPDFFVQTYIGSIEIVRQAIKKFGETILVDVYEKGVIRNDDELYPGFKKVCEVKSVDDFDKIVTQSYNKGSLLKEIS